jgi:hypothetical protein
MSRTTIVPALGLFLLACDPADVEDGDARGSRTCPSSSLPGACEGTSSDGGSSSESSSGHGESGCGESESGDDDGDEGSSDDGEGEADLPYDVKPQLGDVFVLSSAFLEKGPAPAAILSVEHDGGGDWRAAELQGDVAFEITQEDCDHEGNRDIGRDRVNITWQNADGSETTDHLDIRYCES